MDNFCRLDEQMMDYRTKRSGITEKDLENTPCFEDVRETANRISKFSGRCKYINIYIYIYIYIYIIVISNIHDNTYI